MHKHILRLLIVLYIVVKVIKKNPVITNDRNYSFRRT